MLASSLSKIWLVMGRTRGGTKAFYCAVSVANFTRKPSPALSFRFQYFAPKSCALAWKVDPSLERSRGRGKVLNDKDGHSSYLSQTGVGPHLPNRQSDGRPTRTIPSWAPAPSPPSAAPNLSPSSRARRPRRPWRCARPPGRPRRSS